MTPPEPLVQLAKALHEGFARRDFTPLFEVLDESVVWCNHGHPGTPFHGVWRGKQGVRAQLALLDEVDVQRFEPRTYLQADNKVVVLLDVRRLIKITGRLVEGPFVHVLEFRNDKLLRVDVYEYGADG